MSAQSSAGGRLTELAREVDQLKARVATLEEERNSAGAAGAPARRVASAPSGASRALVAADHPNHDELEADKLEQRQFTRMLRVRVFRTSTSSVTRFELRVLMTNLTLIHGRVLQNNRHK